MTDERIAEIERHAAEITRDPYSGYPGDLIRKQVPELIAALREARQDTRRLDFIEQRTRKSYTGVSFDFHKEGNTPQFRMMWHHHICDPRYELRAAIDAAMVAEGVK